MRRLLPALLLVSAARAEPPAAKPADLVTTQVGTVPVIISAPHGGDLVVPGVPERKGEGMAKGGAGFFAGRDTGTEQLAADIAKEVEKRLGGKPYLVVARFHRKYLDANRPPAIAYESPAAQPTYDHFHKLLDTYCQEVQKTHGRGLLIDVHGQGSKADTIFRGTRNGQTVTLLRQRFGEKAHTGPDSLFGLLAKAGATVYPTTEDGKEQAGFTGGHIVGTYGSHTGHGIDAMQLEFGNDYRTAAGRPAAAKKVTDAVEGYAKRYLPTAGKP